MISSSKSASNKLKVLLLIA
uniref:Uncharacterized protein n=1 Tax=Rhizophora mucronata TaxID=61149 RepID=A0A2P2M3F6_RHIMU